MTQSHLLIFSLGYTGTALARAALEAGFAVSATTRDPARAAPPVGVQMVAFDRAGPVIATATHLFATAPPPADGSTGGGVTDPVLRLHGPAIAAAPRLRWVGYCSTTGVYGDHQGGRVDEATPPAPGQPRSRRRLAAEQDFTALAGHCAVDLFRIAGIYGPGRSALDEVRAGRARRILHPGHVFCRIHRDDIAHAVLAAMDQPRDSGVRVLNLADDEPAEPALVVEEAARLLGVPPPPAVAYADVESQLSPMARSFWQESRLVSSARTQTMLGIAWRYPGFREGLRAILAAGQAGGA